MQEKNDLEIFLSLLQQGDLNQARLVFEQKYQFIDPSYRDKGGNTLMHIVVRAACEKLKALLQQGKWVAEVDCVMDFQLLIKILLQHGVPSGLQNKKEENPLCILRSYHTTPSSDFYNMLRVFAEEIEKKEKVLLPGRRYVYDLNLYRISKNPAKICYIPDKWKAADEQDKLELTLHQRLAFYRMLLQNKFDYPVEKNLAVANVGFVVADKSKPFGDPFRKLVFLTFPIQSKYLIFKPSQAEYDGHSEYSLCEFLLKKENLSQFVEKLHEFGYGKNSKIYAVVIDVDSRRMVCRGCGSDLQKLATNEQNDGFVATLQSVFKSEYGKNFNFPSRQRLPVIIRASGRNVHENGRAQHPDDLFPADMVYSQFNRNIKAHGAGTFLHLIPKFKSKDQSFPATFREEDEKFIEESKVKAQENIASFKGKKPFFFKGTAFQSAMGNSYTKTVKDNQNTVTDISQAVCDYAVGIALTI